MSKVSAKEERAGVVLVDKPAGLSSAQVVAKIKRSLNLKKIGHAGTLDPFATGLLICLTGKATRLADYASGGNKIYTGTFILGRSTTSDDVTGEVIAECEVQLNDSEVIQSATQFVGNISQIPPKISAVKIDGQRAYARARAGEDFVIASREVRVETFDLRQLDFNRYYYRVECGPGTYIRSLIRDLGEKLGCGACVETLRREFSYPFSVADATSLDLIGLGDIKNIEVLFPSAHGLYLGESRCRALAGGDQRCLYETEVLTQVQSIANIQGDSSGSKKNPLIYYAEKGGQPRGVLECISGRVGLLLDLGTN